MFERIKYKIDKFLLNEVLWWLELNDMEYEQNIMEKLRGEQKK